MLTRALRTRRAAPIARKYRVLVRMDLSKTRSQKNACQNVMKSNVRITRAKEGKFAQNYVSATSAPVRKEQVWSKENVAMQISPGLNDFY